MSNLIKSAIEDSFEPHKIGKLWAWYDPDYSYSIDVETGKIATYNNRSALNSGNNPTNAVGGSRALYSADFFGTGKNAVLFDGIDDNYNGGDLILGQKFIFFVVFRPTAFIDYNYIVAKATETPATKDWILRTNSLGVLNFELPESGGTVFHSIVSPPTLTINTTYVAACWFDGTNLHMNVNGTQYDGDSATPFTRNISVVPFYIGRRTPESSNGDFFAGYAGKMFFYDGELYGNQAVRITQMINWLKSYYGV